MLRVGRFVGESPARRRALGFPVLASLLLIVSGGGMGDGVGDSGLRIASACWEGVCTFFAVSPLDPSGDRFTFVWDFGEGPRRATGAVVAHAYEGAGWFNVRLFAIDGARRVDAASASVLVTRAPQAAFVASCADRACSFDATASRAGSGEVLEASWDFGDGSAPAEGLSVEHEFAASGAFPVTLSVLDSHGGSATARRTVVANSKPVAAFSGSCSFGACRFDARASQDPDPGDGIREYVWSFADGSGAATGAVVRHAFSKPGRHAVVLSVVDAHGARADAAAKFDVPPAKASFKPSKGKVGWIQVKVVAEKRPDTVCASVDGGSCKALQLRSWGAWAGAMKAPKGSTVRFAATFAGDVVVESGAFRWPSGKPA